MASLPEKWYCEMNKWDPDRAYCGGPEETDSEGEQPSSAGPSQLVLANSKGASALSYRRIIFGTDGRIRPQYSEKNRNGYGLFSFSEAQKQGGQGDFPGSISLYYSYTPISTLPLPSHHTIQSVIVIDTSKNTLINNPINTPMNTPIFHATHCVL